MRTHFPTAFTLVEVLIVVVMLGIMAAIVIPQILGSHDEARIAATNTEIRSVRDAIARYRVETGRFPGYTASGEADTTPGRTPADILLILAARDAATGKGPWIHGVPRNAFDNVSTVNGIGGWTYAASGGTAIFNASLTSVPAHIRSRISNL